MRTASPSTRLSYATHCGRGIQAAAALAWREWIRFVRQRNRVIGAAVQPVVFWLLFGAGLGPSFSLPGEATADVSYFQYFFPGTLLLILLFAAIFTTISIIEDRREGFLQSVLVAPLPRWSMVAGKLLGGTMIALVHAIPFLVLGLFTSGIFISVFQLFAVLLWLGLVGLQMVAAGILAGVAYVKCARISCDYESAPDANVALERSILSSNDRTAEIRSDHQSTFIQPVGASTTFLSRRDACDPGYDDCGASHHDALHLRHADRYVPCLCDGMDSCQGPLHWRTTMTLMNLLKVCNKKHREHDRGSECLFVFAVFFGIVLSTGGCERGIREGSSLHSSRSEKEVLPATERVTPTVPADHFQLTQTDGGTFDSSSLLGKVWMGSIFLPTAPAPASVKIRPLLKSYGS